LNLGMMIEIILGPLASSFRNGNAQGLFAQSPAPRQIGEERHPFGRGGGTTCSAAPPPNKICISTVCGWKSFETASFKLSTRGLSLGLFVASLYTFGQKKKRATIH
jgi:hypothetical protein